MPDQDLEMQNMLLLYWPTFRHVRNRSSYFGFVPRQHRGGSRRKPIFVDKSRFFSQKKIINGGARDLVDKNRRLGL